MDHNGDDRFMDWSDVAGLAPPSLLARGRARLLARATDYDRLQLGRSTNWWRLDDAWMRPSDSRYPPSPTLMATTMTRWFSWPAKPGYRIGFTTQRGLVAEGDDALRLRRLNVHEASTRSRPEFLCLILGVFHKWPRQV